MSNLGLPTEVSFPQLQYFILLLARCEYSRGERWVSCDLAELVYWLQISLARPDVAVGVVVKLKLFP